MLRVLHLSDIHFSTTKKPFAMRIKHQDVREQVVKSLESLTAAERTMQAILLVGDIAFSASPDEYEEAYDWIERIRTLCNCRRESVLTVPGNHDVDRRAVRKSVSIAYERLREANPEEAEMILGELIKEPGFEAPLANYQSFASVYATPFRNGSARWIREFELDPGRHIAFVGVNSARVSNDKDAPNAMFLGRDAFTIPDRHCVEQILVAHHPLEWLRDRVEAEAIIEERSRVSIFGHEHRQKLSKIEIFSGTPRAQERLVLASGAVTPDETNSQYTFRFNILEFDYQQVRGSPRLATTVRAFVWSQSSFISDLSNGGSRPTTIHLKAKRWTAPLGASTPPADASILGLPIADPISDVRHAFWRKLNWNQRIAFLRKAGAHIKQLDRLNCDAEAEALADVLLKHDPPLLLKMIDEQGHSHD